MADEPAIKITLGDGSVVTGKDMDEAFATVAKMKEDTAAELRAARDEAQRWQNEAEQEKLRNRQQANPQPQNGNQNGNQPYTIGDPNAWWAKAAQNPVDAITDALAAKFGVNPDQLVNGLRWIDSQTRQNAEAINNFNQQTVTATFQSLHPEYDIANQGNHSYMGKKMEEFSEKGIPFSLESMNLAYSMGVNEGKIKTVTQQNNQQQQQQQQREEPNPSLSRSGSGSTSQNELPEGMTYDQAMNMPIDELRARLVKAGLKGI